MPNLDTKLFGSVAYDPQQLIRLCAALPGLGQVEALLPLSQPEMEPFLFFQATNDPSISLLAVPARVVQGDFQLWLSEDDRASLGLPEDAERPGAEVGAFALVAVSDDQSPTANLLAPLAVHFARNLALQAIQPLTEDFLRCPIDASGSAKANSGRGAC